MFRILFFLLLILAISCDANKRQPPSQKQKSLSVGCENERILIESPLYNKEYSFDSINTVSEYWKILKIDQKRLPNEKVYPYTLISLDTSSIYHNLKVGLVGSQDWRPDGRPKIFLEDMLIDSTRIIKFFEKISKISIATNDYEAYLQRTKSKAEIILLATKDSIYNLSSSLSKIAQIYISFQKLNSEKKFQTQLCSLNFNNLDSLKRDVPLRIRLISELKRR